MAHSVDYELKRANKALRNGKNSEAKNIYSNILKAFPGNIRAKTALKNLDANFSGNQTGINQEEVSLLKKYYGDNKNKEAIDLANKLLVIQPDNPEILNYKGASHGRLTQLDEALECFEQAKKFSVEKSAINNNIGSVWREKGNYALALEFYKAALEEKPLYFDAQKNLGATYHKMDKNNEALVEFKKALLIKQDDVEILSALGTIYNQLCENDKAINVYKNILKINPQHKQTLNNLGNIYLGNKCFDKAVKSYEKALSIDPNYSDALNNLANALKDMGYLDEAIYYYEKAIEAPKARTELYSNYGVALKDRGYFERAMKVLDIALAQKPDYPDAQWNKALVYLCSGDFENGWKAYEWRWQATNFDSTFIQSTKPVWEGRKERVLIWPEQGLGDQVMFSTLFREFAEKCELAIFQVDRRLLPLFRRTYPNHYFIPSDKMLSETEYDSHIPMGSLPMHLRVNKQSFRQHTPVNLVVDNTSKTQIRQAFRLGKKKLIGVSWKSKNTDSGQRRSIKLSEMLRIFDHKDCEIVSLQYGDTAEDIQKAFEETGIAVKTVDQIDTFSNIDQLASLIACCDEVVTIDNSTVHLSAAIGVKTHLLLPFVCDWRWFAHTHGSLWYNDLNVYRKETIDQSWLDVIPKVNLNIES